VGSRIGGTLWKAGAQAPTYVGGKTFTPVAWYPSSSDPNKGYTVCEVSDGTTSCDCMGWTRRNPLGGRTCKHTQDYEAYLRGTQPSAISKQAKPAAMPDPPVTVKPKAEPKSERGGSLEDLFKKLDKTGI